MSSDLSKEVLSLVRAEQQEMRPTSADKARVRQLLNQRLQGLPGSNPSQAPAGGLQVSAATWPKLAAGIVGVAAVATMVWQFFSATPEAATVPRVVTSATLPVVGTAEPQAQTLAAPVATLDPNDLAKAPASTASPSQSASRGEDAKPDSLAAEVALLKKAQKEYQAHNYTRALALVEEHRRKFPHGGLVQEGITLRMRLLCALGRDEDAVREQGALQRVSSGHTSPQPDKPCQNL
ncbi:MAG TPA: hypothetical protein VHM70_30950 [Polyangiaceae bacterium]|nr:hypothetical protein [Polyangiaceae bacterium]